MICCVSLVLLLSVAVWLRPYVRAIMGRGIAHPLAWRLDGASQQTATSSAHTFSLKARVKSFSYAFGGLMFMARNEHNAWLHLIASMLVIILGVVLQVSAVDWRWLVLAIGWVWFAEAINTALEEFCDAVCPTFNNGIGRVKDIAAGAVLISAVVAVVLGLLTFVPYLTSDQPPSLTNFPLCIAPR